MKTERPMLLTVHIGGPSGCGKSSLADKLAELLKAAGVEFDLEDPCTGRGVIQDKDWTHNPGYSLQNLQATHVCIRVQRCGKRSKRL